LPQKAAPAGKGCLQLTQNVDCIKGPPIPDMLSKGVRANQLRDWLPCKHLLLHAYYSIAQVTFL